MARVAISPKPVAVLLGVMSFFALTGLVAGTLLVVFCQRIGATATGSTAFAIVAGIAMILAGLKFGIWTVGQWRAVREIDVAEDGAWRLADHLGRHVTIPAAQAVTVEVVAYDKTVWRPLPQRLHQTAGRIVAGARTWRIATSARSTYDRVLKELGLANAAPREGLGSYERRRVA